MAQGIVLILTGVWVIGRTMLGGMADDLVHGRLPGSGK